MSIERVVWVGQDGRARLENGEEIELVWNSQSHALGGRAVKHPSQEPSPPLGIDQIGPPAPFPRLSDLDLDQI